MKLRVPDTITDFTAVFLVLATAPLRLVAWALGTVLGSLRAGFINGWYGVR